MSNAKEQPTKKKCKKHKSLAQGLEGESEGDLTVRA